MTHSLIATSPPERIFVNRVGHRARAEGAKDEWIRCTAIAHTPVWGRASREEDLLPPYVDACSHNIPTGEQRPVILPCPIRMELLAIIAMVTIAVWLPPVRHSAKAT